MVLIERIPSWFAADSEANTQQDVLTCGACQKGFALGDIVKFIQHKVLVCNKENYFSSAAAGDGHRCGGRGSNHHEDVDSSDEGGGLAVGTRRPSISAPITAKKSTPVPGHCTPPPSVSPRFLSSTPKRSSTSPGPGKDEPVVAGSSDDELKLRIKQEHLDSSPDEPAGKRSRTEFADAESNTTNSGKYYMQFFLDFGSTIINIPHKRQKCSYILLNIWG